MTVCLGIDPGGHSTGVVVRGPDGLRAHQVLNRTKSEPIETYARRVVETIVTDYLLATDERVIPDIAGVEGLNPPNPHLGITSLQGLVDTAVVLGAVIAQLPADWAHVIPPGNHGSAPLATYPAALVGKREKTGTGERRHARSAWDIAAAALTVHRIKTRRATA